MVTRIQTASRPPRLYVAEWRQQRSMTQEQLADRIESTKATISRWETGDRDPPLKALTAIAAALNIHVPDLFYSPDLVDVSDAIGKLRSLPPDLQGDVLANLNSTLALVNKRGKIGG